MLCEKQYNTAFFVWLGTTMYTGKNNIIQLHVELQPYYKNYNVSLLV